MLCFYLHSVCTMQSTIERLVKDKMPKKSARWWFWRRRDMDNNQVDSQEAVNGYSFLYAYVKPKMKCYMF